MGVPGAESGARETDRGSVGGSVTPHEPRSEPYLG